MKQALELNLLTFVENKEVSARSRSLLETWRKHVGPVASRWVVKVQVHERAQVGSQRVLKVFKNVVLSNKIAEAMLSGVPGFSIGSCK